MKAVQLVQAGRLPVFERRVVDDRQPGVGEVLVALEATGLNRRDAWLWEQTDLALPSTLGSDGAGIVRAVGEAVSGVRVGDEVVINPGLDWGADEEAGGSSFEILGVPRAGTFADLVVVPSENVAPKPRRLSWEEAATLGVAAITAWRAVTRSTTNLVGARILVPGAGGGGRRRPSALASTRRPAEARRNARNLRAQRRAERRVRLPPTSLAMAEGSWHDDG